MSTDRTQYVIKPIDYENVIEYFNTHHNNSNNTIAKTFNLHTNYVNFILDFYLSMKKNYYKVGW